MFQNKVDVLQNIQCSDKICVEATKQQVMILTDAVLEESPDVYVNAIHNSYQDGTGYAMNFELSNGYVTKQTSLTTAHRHVIPGAVFTHTTQVLVHYDDYVYSINGFRFLDA